MVVRHKNPAVLLEKIGGILLKGLQKHFQQAVCNTFCHVSYGREPCSLQRQIRVTAFFIDNTGDGNIPGWRQIFLNTGPGSDGTGTHEDRTDMFIRTKRSINSYDRAVRMLLFYFCIYIRKIQRMGGMMQRTVDIQREGGMVQRTADIQRVVRMLQSAAGIL